MDVFVLAATAQDASTASHDYLRAFWSGLPVILATLLGPVLAIQVQKWLERLQLIRQRKEQVFETLMATRNAPMAPEHVKALNLIEVTFYGRGPGRRRETEDSVLDQWRYYLSFLTDVGAATQPLTAGGQHQSPAPHHFQRRDELFVDLLASIAKDLGYHYEKANLKPTSGYSPASHNDVEQARSSLIFAANDVLAGRRSIPVEVTQTNGQL